MITPRPSFTNPHALRMMRDRALAAIWQRCRRWLAFILIIFLFTLSIVIAGKTAAADVPAWVLRGIAAVETGTDWRDMGDVRGTWSRGAIGEVGPWQLSPAVLRDLKAYDRRDRVHTCPVLAESLTRAWLLHLRTRTGSWWETCAAYNAGLGNRWSATATDYANRVTLAGTAAEVFGTSSAAGAAPLPSVEPTN